MVYFSAIPNGGDIVVTSETPACQHNLNVVEKKNATCEVDGTNAYYVCKLCGTNFADSTGKTPIEDINVWKNGDGKIAKKGHSYTLEKTAEIAATCTTDGKTAVYQCVNCTSTIGGDTISKLGHDYVLGGAKEPTCEEKGLKAVGICSRCHAYQSKQEEIPATGHKPVSLPAVKATCTTNGLTEGSKCSTCNSILVAQIEVRATGHRYSSEWTYDEDNHWKAYTCGHDEAVTKFSHAFGTWTIVKEATETEPGLMTRKCLCGYVKNEEIEKLPHITHKWDAGKITKAATENEAGVKTYTCTICKETKVDPIPKLEKKTVEEEKPVTQALKKQSITVAKAAKKTVTFKASKLKVKKATLKIGAKAKTKLSYKVSKYPKNGKKYISVSSKGVVTMKKGAKKGTYKVTITAKSDKNYAKATKVITIKVK